MSASDQSVKLIELGKIKEEFVKCFQGYGRILEELDVALRNTSTQSNHPANKGLVKSLTGWLFLPPQILGLYDDGAKIMYLTDKIHEKRCKLDAIGQAYGIPPAPPTQITNKYLCDSQQRDTARLNFQTLNRIIDHLKDDLLGERPGFLGSLDPYWIAIGTVETTFGLGCPPLTDGKKVVQSPYIKYLQPVQQSNPHIPPPPGPSYPPPQYPPT